MSIAGCIYLLISNISSFLTDFSYKDSIYPYAKVVCITVEGIVLVIFALSIFFYNKHILFYTGIELLVFLNIYTNNIYISLFLSSIVLVFILIENTKVSPAMLISYSLGEVIKLAMILPYGLTDLFRYFALSLFAVCSIGCINLLFHHAYSKTESSKMNLEKEETTSFSFLN